MEQKTITGKIINVTKAGSGEGKYGPWTRYQVTIQTDKGQADMSVFDEGFLALIGKSGSWTYTIKENEKNGRIYKNYTLDKLPKPNPQIEDILRQLERLNKAVFGEKKVTEAEQGIDDFGPEEPKGESIDVDSLPF